jgi:acyl carrier protein
MEELLMNQNDDLKNELRTLIADTIEIYDFADDEDFITDLGADSMMIIEIVARLERKYKINLREEHFSRMKTFGDVFETVQEIMIESGLLESAAKG